MRVHLVVGPAAASSETQNHWLHTTLRNFRIHSRRRTVLQQNTSATSTGIGTVYTVSLAALTAARIEVAQSYQAASGTYAGTVTMWEVPRRDMAMAALLLSGGTAPVVRGGQRANQRASQQSSPRGEASQRQAQQPFGEKQPSGQQSSPLGRSSPTASTAALRVDAALRSAKQPYGEKQPHEQSSPTGVGSAAVAKSIARSVVATPVIVKPAPPRPSTVTAPVPATQLVAPVFAAVPAQSPLRSRSTAVRASPPPPPPPSATIHIAAVARSTATSAVAVAKDGRVASRSASARSAFGEVMRADQVSRRTKAAASSSAPAARGSTPRSGSRMRQP
jgi:hypothetical protein